MISQTLPARVVPAIFLLTLLSGMIPAQRAITNPSTEDPAFANGTVVQQAEGTMPGWLTSHPIQPGACGGSNCRPIERWSTGAVGVSPATGAGVRWVELNAFTNSMIYQSICMTNGESFGYSFVHRGRQSATVRDVAQFRLGIPIGLPAGSKPADSYSFPIVQVSTTNNGATDPPTGSGTINAPAAAGNGWVRYSGTYNYTGTTQVLNIGFAAISTAGGAIAAGNLIDDLQITLSPYVEFSPASASGVEGSVGGSNTPANRPGIRVGGAVTAPITVTFQIAGGSAVIGTDYSLTVPFQAGNTTSTATVTIPIGTYAGTDAGSLFPIPFSINTDTVIEQADTVDFAITSAPGATIASVVGCGIAPITNSTYTIFDDDAPTAANVSLSGRVLTTDGRGIRNTAVVLTGPKGNSRTAMTSSFGYYRFDEVPSGETYVLSVSSKRYQFAPRVVTVQDEIANLDFIAQE
jgi:hypothetical protein